MNIEKQLFIVLKNGTTEKQIFILKRKKVDLWSFNMRETLIENKV